MKFIFCIFLILCSCTSSKEKQKNAENTQDETNIERIIVIENTEKIIGKVVIYGNEPHTFAAIACEDGTEYLAYPQSQKEMLMQLQGRLVEFTVIFLDNIQDYEAIPFSGKAVTVLDYSF